MMFVALIPQEPADERSSVVSQLPVELLSLIVGYLCYDKSDLRRLCCTSKTLRNLALPFLYHTTILGLTHDGSLRSGQKLLNNLKILKLVHSPGIAAAITDLEVVLSSSACPQDWNRFLRYTTTFSQECTCDLIDNTAGEAIKAMINLERLSVTSSLHPSTIKCRHQWIQNPVKPKLRYLVLRYHCTTDNDVQPLTLLPNHVLNLAEDVKLYSNALISRPDGSSTMVIRFRHA